MKEPKTKQKAEPKGQTKQTKTSKSKSKNNQIRSKASSHEYAAQANKQTTKQNTKLGAAKQTKPPPPSTRYEHTRAAKKNGMETHVMSSR